MKPLSILAMTTALVLGLAGAARAGGTRVVVAGPEGDPVATRLQKELIAMGYEPVRVDDAATCSRGAIEAWINEMHAAGAACSDGTTVGVWVVGRTGLRRADVVSPSADDAHAPDVVAVRAAEVARASLELPDGDRDADVAPAPPARPVPSWTDTPPLREVDVAQAHKPPRAPPPRTPVVAFGAGVADVFGTDATDLAVDLELELRVARYMALSARADLPVQSTNVAARSTLVRIAPGVFAFGPVFPLASPDAFLIPRLGTGVGVVWLQSDASGGSAAPRALAPGSAPSDSMSSTIGHRDDIFSPMAYANAAVSMRVVGPLRVAVDAMLGTTAQRMVVRDQGTHIAYWGQPFGTLALRAEMLFR